MQNLVIVESPTKARTLTRFLGGDYRIEATLGHLKDLPRKKLGIEIKKTAKDNSLEFTPQYVIIPERKKRLLELKQLSQKADNVILATDPDREGEAIAYHVLHELGGGQAKNKSKISRIVFHEITKEAIDEALKNPGEVDLKLVDAQQARRILDRLVGYSLSPLLWNKLSKRWLSAGRVQSVTVRLIVEREREIEKFKKEEFWRIFGIYAGYNENFEAELISKNQINYETTQSFDLFDGKYTVSKTSIQTEAEAKKIIEDLQTPFTVSAVDKKEIKRSPPPPFTTSKLQQDAGRVLYFSSKKTMQIAQKLYEEGVITYHRTDSFNLSEKFLTSAKSYIEKNYGQTYHNGQYRRYTTKSKVAQEAHEAIRPTKIEVTGPELFQVSADFNKDHVKLYELIWKRAVASQGSDAVFDATTIQITSASGYLFETKGSVIKFEGYLKIAGRNSDDKLLPTVAVGDELKAKEFTKTQNFTAPPPRYSESSLIKVLEEKGIGRPSTYAPTISIIQDRQYAEKIVDEDGKKTNRFKPTDLGFLVTDFLVKYFADIINLPFTAGMEDSLDDIAAGAKNWQPVLSEFYVPFKEILDKVYKTAEKVEEKTEEVGEKCPQCQNELIFKTGRFGRFIACSKFPECKFTRNIIEKIDVKCPRCAGDMVVKKTRRGKQFYGCGNYPKCNFAAWKKEDIK